jgi:transposase
MALGKRRRDRQLEAFVVAADLPKPPGHPFYTALNRLLAEHGFDPMVEKLCAPYYAETMGRPGVPPGVFFRMLLVGYFEGLVSHRAISWRCSDSRSLGEFLGLAPTDPVPNHSCVSKTHKRLPKEVFDEVFRFILRVAARKGLLSPEAIGIDSTTIQANASMRSIVRKDSGKGWKDYTKKLAKKAGLSDPSDDELRQFDRTRPGKKVSNDDWENPHDPDAAITRMKDGTTRMGYKAEHAVDLETDIVGAVNVQSGNAPDTATIIDTAIDAAVNAEHAGAETDVKAIVADKGYHSSKVVTLAADLGMRAYIPERTSPKQRRWTDKDPAETRAVYATRRRTKGARGKQLCRLRSELTERSFAHVCDTGGARRTWLRGLASVAKRHLMVVAARNLSTIMRAIIGIGGPRSLQGLRALLQTAWTHFDRLISALDRLVAALVWSATHGTRAPRT